MVIVWSGPPGEFPGLDRWLVFRCVGVYAGVRIVEDEGLKRHPTVVNLYISTSLPI